MARNHSSLVDQYWHCRIFVYIANPWNDRNRHGKPWLWLSNEFLRQRLFTFYDRKVEKQKAQITLCYIVYRVNRMSRVTPYVEKLRWLPISYCILLKYNLLTFKTIICFQTSLLPSLILSSMGICYQFPQTFPKRWCVGMGLLRPCR